MNRLFGVTMGESARQPVSVDLRLAEVHRGGEGGESPLPLAGEG
jgi:hypothetical protein